MRALPNADLWRKSSKVTDAVKAGQLGAGECSAAVATAVDSPFVVNIQGLAHAGQRGIVR